MASRFGATGAVPFEKTTQFFHAHIVPHGSLPLSGTVLKAIAMQPSGWTSGKSDVFSALRAQPIRRQKSSKLRSTTRRRTPSTRNHCHSRCFQLPLISFRRPLLGSSEVGVRQSTVRALLPPTSTTSIPRRERWWLSSYADEARRHESAEALRSLPADRTTDQTVGRSAGVLYFVEKGTYCVILLYSVYLVTSARASIVGYY